MLHLPSLRKFKNFLNRLERVFLKPEKQDIGETVPILLDHACSISQDLNNNFITEDEAHYICAILNSEIVTSYIKGSSDTRSYKTDLPIKLNKYDKNNKFHRRLADLSKLAHKKVKEGKDIIFVEKCINRIALKIYE